MNTGLLSWLLPGYIDEARRRVQQPLFEKALHGTPWKGRCLNAGCGEGLYAEFLGTFPAVTEITHMDLQKPSFCASLAPRHQAAAGSVTALPFPNEHFDCCLCSEVLEHVSDDRKAIQELSRVLTPGGYLLLSTPTPPAPTDPAHVREGYTLGEMTTLLTAGGFAVRSHAVGFHLLLRWTMSLWQWQFHTLGRTRRSFVPRIFLVASAWLDRRLPLGKPWDLVVLAQKQ